MMKEANSTQQWRNYLQTLGESVQELFMIHFVKWTLGAALNTSSTCRLQTGTIYLILRSQNTLCLPILLSKHSEVQAIKARKKCKRNGPNVTQTQCWVWGSITVSRQDKHPSVLSDSGGSSRKGWKMEEIGGSQS